MIAPMVILDLVAKVIADVNHHPLAVFLREFAFALLVHVEMGDLAWIVR